MKKLTLLISDGVYDKLKAFFEIIPKDSVTVIEETGIIGEFVSDDEQKDLEEILRDPDSNYEAHSKEK
jgi:hypothetical protein